MMGSGGGRGGVRPRDSGSRRASCIWAIRLTRVASLALATACTHDSSPLNVVPLAPVATNGTGALMQTAAVGTRVPEPPAIRVTDRFGNPVQGVEVLFEVTVGEGWVTRVIDTTDADGEASTRWALGTTAGPNELRAGPAGLGPVIFAAVGQPLSPSVVIALSGSGQVATVTAALANTLVAEVRDIHGNLTPGVPVEWLPSDTSAVVLPTSSEADSLGRARALWTLGTIAGLKEVRVRAGSVEVGGFLATAIADSPAELLKVSGDGQTGPAGSALPQRLVARLVDRYGNGVEGASVVWTVLGGEGSVQPDETSTDAEGLASARYVVGRTPQATERVTASFGSLGAADFTAHTGEPDNLVVDRMYVTQVTQNAAGSVPLVAGRDGLLRVFVLARSENAHSANVEVRFFHDGVLVRSETLDRASESVPTEASAADLAQSWNMLVPGELIRPGLSIVAEADPEDRVYESEEADNVFPAGGALVEMDVRSLPDFRVRLVPIQMFTPAGNSTGDVRDGNKSAYVSAAFKMFPMRGFDVDVRAVFTSGVGDLRDLGHWTSLLNEIATLRVADGSSRYYYGTAGFQPSAFCGLGDIGAPTAVGMDGACGPSTAAHEWGHNFARRHAPCGNPSRVDGAYPYAGGSIGVYGLDVERLDPKSPGAFSDLMSYCDPVWISDYTYEGILQFREAESAAAHLVAPARQPAMVVWGRIERDRLVLEPTFEATTLPKLPDAPGSYRLTGIAADGTELFSLSFAATPVDHAEADIRHFAFAVPLDLAQPSNLESLRLTAPGTALAPAEVRRQTSPLALPSVRATREGPDRVRLDWAGVELPLIVVRDPDSGEILAFARGLTALIDSEADELDLTFAPGLGGLRRRVLVR